MIRVPMTGEQASALAAFLVTLRPGQRAWNKQAVYDALVAAGEKFSADAEALARAAIRASLTPSIRTPEVIAMPGEHWEGIHDPPMPSVGYNRKHIVCGRFHPDGDPCPGPIVISRSTAEHVAAARLAVNGKRAKTYVKPPPARASEDVPLPAEENA